MKASITSLEALREAYPKAEAAARLSMGDVGWFADIMAAAYRSTLDRQELLIAIEGQDLIRQWLRGFSNPTSVRELLKAGLVLEMSDPVMANALKHCLREYGRQALGPQPRDEDISRHLREISEAGREFGLKIGDEIPEESR